MRNLVIVLVIAVILATSVAFAAPAPPAKAPAAAKPSAPAGWLGPLANAAKINGSHLDIDVYLDMGEVLALLSKSGMLPKEVADQLAAEGKPAARAGGRPAADDSFVRVQAHVRLSQVVSLLNVTGALQPPPAPQPDKPATEAPAPAASAEQPAPSAPAETPPTTPTPANSAAGS